MEWFNVKEKSAGKHRLLLCYYLYKLFGKNIVKFIAFFVALFTYIQNSDIREVSTKYFKIISEYTNDEKLKPCFLNSFKRVLSYAFSLVDKIEVYLQKFDTENIEFFDVAQRQKLEDDIKSGGVFFICNHIGNVDVMRSLFCSDKYSKDTEVSIFLQQNHCKIFNDFLNSLKFNIDKIKIYPVEEIDLSTANLLDESLKNGGVAFVAGDRISSYNNKYNLETSFLNKKIKIPTGVFRFAKLMQTNIYFISSIKENNKYKIYLKKVNNSPVENLQKEYTDFLEKMTIKAPFQFYHFYDFF